MTHCEEVANITDLELVAGRIKQKQIVYLIMKESSVQCLYFVSDFMFKSNCCMFLNLLFCH